MNLQEIKKIEKKIQEILERLIEKEAKIIAGISGGPDSIFLLHFLKNLPNKTIVAHINHNLRKEALSEENFVKEICKKENLTFECKNVDIKTLAKKSKRGIEETGRKVRYDFFKLLAKKHHVKYIITAHHADDNLETIIFNFARGAGLKGLSGINKKEKLDQYFLLRPLINIPKKHILAYLKAKRIHYKKDQSNKDLKYNRNFIRLKIIPELQKLNPNLTETISKNTKNLKETHKYFIKLAKNWISKNTISKTLTTICLKAQTFRTKPQILKNYILRHIYKTLAGDTQNLESKHLEEVNKIITKNIGNKEKKFGKLTARIKNNVITIEKETKKVHYNK